MFKHIRKQDDKSLLEQGFTLIELLVVVAILGILAAVAIFAVGNLTSDAKKNACQTEAASVETAGDAYAATHDTPAADIAALKTEGLLKGTQKYAGATPNGYTYSVVAGKPVVTRVGTCVPA